MLPDSNVGAKTNIALPANPCYANIFLGYNVAQKQANL